MQIIKQQIKRYDYWVVAFLISIAILLRLLYLSELRQNKLNQFSSNSDAYNIEMAAKGIIEKVSHNYHLHFVGSKAYSSILSFFYRSDHGLYLTQLFQVLLSALGILLLFLALKKLFSAPVGIIGAFLLTFYNMDILFSGQISFASVTSFCLILVLYVISKYIKTASLSNFCWVSLSLIFLSLFSRHYWICYFGFVIFHLLKSDSKPRFKYSSVSGALLIGIAIFSYTKPDFPLDLNYGIHVYIGNNESANGIYKKIPNIRPNSKGHLIDGILLSNNPDLNPEDSKHYFLTQTWNFFNNHPRQFLNLIKTKFMLMFNQYEPSNTSSLYYQKVCCKSLRYGFINFGIIFPFFVLGLVLSWKKRKELMYFYFLFVFQVLLFLTIFIADRYRFQLVPVIIVFGALGLSSSIEIIISRDWRKILILGSILALGMAFTHQKFDFLNEQKDLQAEEMQRKQLKFENNTREQVLKIYRELDGSVSFEKLYALGRNLKILNLSREAEDVFLKVINKTTLNKRKAEVLVDLANVQEDMFEFQKALETWKELERIDKDSEIAQTRIKTINNYLGYKV